MQAPARLDFERKGFLKMPQILAPAALPKSIELRLFALPLACWAPAASRIGS